MLSIEFGIESLVWYSFTIISFGLGMVQFWYGTVLVWYVLVWYSFHIVCYGIVQFWYGMLWYVCGLTYLGLLIGSNHRLSHCHHSLWQGNHKLLPYVCIISNHSQPPPGTPPLPQM